jgi:hypothetical protein
MYTRTDDYKFKSMQSFLNTYTWLNIYIYTYRWSIKPWVIIGTLEFITPIPHRGFPPGHSPGSIPTMKSRKQWENSNSSFKFNMNLFVYVHVYIYMYTYVYIYIYIYIYICIYIHTISNMYYIHVNIWISTMEKMVWCPNTPYRPM